MEERGSASRSGHAKRKRQLGDVRRWSPSGRTEPTRKSKRRRRSGDDEGTRRWVFSSRDLSSFKERFVVVSYNILGVENASKHLDLYNQIDPEHLSWEKRKKRIQKELTHYNPSILCFQEVDRFKDLADLLQGDGYRGVYKGRTGEARDGCAIFWKEKEFSLIHQEDIEFQKFGLRNNVAQLCLLKVSCGHLDTTKNGDPNSPMKKCNLYSSTSCRTLLVGNIHVLFNPNRGDIKLGQVRLLLERANALSQKYSNTPIIISGDLNSIPKSAIYKYIASSEIDILQYDRKKISGLMEFPVAKRTYCTNVLRMKYRWSEEEISLASGSSGCTRIQNPLKLFSAYQGIPVNHNTRDSNGEPLATSFHSKFMGTVDYIWHSSALVPVGVVDTLPLHILKRLPGLPCKKWGSDHLALVCKFAFADNISFAGAICDS